MKKYITDKMVEAEMIKRGLPTTEGNEDVIQKAVLDYYDVEITSNYTQSADYYVYTETTADQYEVFIATHDDRNICVNEHVHYYDTNLATELEEAITGGGMCTIYVADEFIDEYWYSDMFNEIYQSICEITEQEIKDILIDEGYEEQTN